MSQQSSTPKRINSVCSLTEEKRAELVQSKLGSDLLNIFLEHSLTCVFQPIIDLKSKRPCAFEGLVRGPFNSALYHPLNLFQVAEEQGVLYEMDTFARAATIQAFAEQAVEDEHLHLFLNISINSVMNSAHQKGLTLEVLETFGLSPERVVIEITELQPVDNFEDFISAIEYYRSIGFKVAIDDLGSGYNGLRIWSEVRPDFVKIDRHFVSDIHLNDDKKMFMKTLMTLAKSTNTRVVAEGVETEQELQELIKLEVDLVQGYLFKKPEEKISEQLLYEWREQPQVINLDRKETVAEIAFEHPTVSPKQSVNEVSEQFLKHPEVDYFPVVDGKKVQGMVWRRDLMNLLARKFGPELHARKVVGQIMDQSPIVVDAKTSLVELSRLVTESDAFNFKDSFIIEKKRNYLGCGNFRDLLRKMTDLKVQSAQHANPLSGLPGNVPIQNKLSSLLNRNHDFVVMYIDVDNFKPFNDYYSFEEGDRVIGLISDILSECVPHRQVQAGSSFIGHIGGDDFVVMTSEHENYLNWANKILKRFQKKVMLFYSQQDREQGGIQAKSREGDSRFFPIMTLSIGILLVHPQNFEHTQKLSSLATKAKKGAKAAGGNTCFIVDSKQ